MNDEPKVSVIMGIYNCEKTLSQALDSIIEQTYTNWELVLCDDGSTDGTYELAEKYRQKYPDRVILLRNESNKKLSYTLNRCLKAASGDLIARMDGDDYSHKDRLEKQVNYLKDHQDIQLVGTSMHVFDEKGFVDEMHARVDPDPKTIGSKVPFYHATILTYRSVLEKLNGYSEKSRNERAEDIELYFRFFHEGFKGANLDEMLYDVRVDYKTLKRRTVRNRMNYMLTLIDGYHLMRYPVRQLMRPIILTGIKVLVPIPVVYWLRGFRKTRSRGDYHVS